MPSLELTFRQVMKYTYAFDLDTFAKVLYDKESDYTIEEKWRKMRTDFVNWYCETDIATATKFLDAATANIMNQFVSEKSIVHKGISCHYNANSTLILTFPYALDPDYQNIVCHVVGEHVDSSQVYFENDKKLVIFDTHEDNGLKKICKIITNAINEIKG